MDEVFEHLAFKKGRPLCPDEKVDIKSRLTFEDNHLWIKDTTMESFKKPLVAQYTKAFVGISIFLALFGVWALLRTRKRAVTEDGSKPSGAP